MPHSPIARSFTRRSLAALLAFVITAAPLAPASAAWNDTLTDGTVLTAQRWNDLVTAVASRISIPGVCTNGQALTYNGSTFVCSDISVSSHTHTGVIQGDSQVNVTDSGTNGTVAITTDGAERVRITNAGNVGIGTTTPSNKLEVFDASGPQVGVSNGTHRLYIGSDANQPWIGTSTNSALRLITSAIERLRITATGDIGIGTTTPGARLEVAGNIIASEPTAANHVATKNYVDTKAISAHTHTGIVNGTSQVNIGASGGDVTVSRGGTTRMSIGANGVVAGPTGTASGTNSFAAGENNTASNVAAVALGSANISSAAYAFTAGGSNTASGNGATAIGLSNTASAQGAAAIGQSATASGGYATALGNGTTAQALGSTAVGSYNIAAGSTGSWVATDPVFVVGNGQDNATRSNALTILKNGAATFSSTVSAATPTAGTHLTTKDYVDTAVAAATGSTYIAGTGLQLSGNTFSASAKLQALDGLTWAADRLPYATGASTAALATFTSFARSILDDADAATVRATLGLGGLSTLSAVGSTEITDGSITNTDISASAAIATSKISGLGSLATLSAVGSSQITDASIVDADISASAAIAASKISGLGSLATLSAVGSSQITDASITGTDIASSTVADGNIIGMSISKLANAASAYFGYRPNNVACTDQQTLKWDNTNSRWICGTDNTGLTAVTSSDITDGTIVNADISASAAIATSKISGLGSLATLSAVGSSQITDASIVDADISASAAITPSKIALDASNRFVTDAEKTSWNAKQSALGYTPVNKAGDTITGAMTHTFGTLGGTTGNEVVRETQTGNTGNTDNLISRILRIGTGSDWTSAAWELRRRVDSTDQGFLRFGIGSTFGVAIGSGSTVRLAIPASGDLTVDGNKVFHAGNDGAGSGLDADILDGVTPGATGLALLDDPDAATARTTLGLGSLSTLSTVGSSQITDASIVDADISASAAIAASKISGLGSLATLSAVGSSQITDASITGTDIASGTIGTGNINMTALNAAVAPTWANVSGKPSTFAPDAHTHTGIVNGTSQVNIGTSNGTISATVGGAEQLRINSHASAVNYLSLSGGATSIQPTIGVEGSDTNIGLKLITKGTGGTLFQSSGGSSSQFNIAHTANAVNYLQVSGAGTGGSPYILPQGSDANIGLQLYSKGTSPISFSTNGASEQFRVSHVASAVNYLQAFGAATGNSPSILASGSDANSGINLSAKGTGSIFLKTNGGNQNSFVASPSGTSDVNYLQATSSATGNAPSVAAIGSDANIDLTLTPKGAAGIQISQTTAPSTTTNKLYNVSGNLFWNGTQLGVASTPTSIANGTSNVTIGSSGGDIAFVRGGASRMTIGAANSGVNVSDLFSVTGTFGSGDTLALAGAGTRAFFYPRKAAFRAGYIDGAQWNDANVGNYSVAFGQNNTASGLGAFAVGTGNTSSGAAAFAAGNGSSASGQNAVAMGNSATASDGFTIAIGQSVTASGQNATAIGQYSTANATNSTAMGLYGNAGSFGETSFGLYPLATAGTIGSRVETDTLFEIGNGTGTGSRANALTMLKNGNTTLVGSFQARSFSDTVTSQTSVSTSATLADPTTNGNVSRILLTGNSTLTLPNPTTASNEALTLTVIVQQDSTGSRTLAWSGGSNTLKWSGSSAPSVCTAASSETIYSFVKIDSVWYGAASWQSC